MTNKEINKIVNQYYPLISKDYSGVSPKVELHKNIYKRLSGISAIDEEDSYAEYDWSNNTIYIYTDHLNSEEDIIRSLIHECVHSTQSHEIYEAYYECDLDYETHPYEIEAKHEEEKWRDYKFADFDEWMNNLIKRNGVTKY